MKAKTKSEIRVGIFVITALTIAGIVVFAVGNRRNVFSTKSTYFAYFDDVAGLRPGGPVHMGGVHVGTVGSVTLQDDGRIRVKMFVVKEVTDLIRTDSVATVGSKGMLGDRLIDINPGSGSAKKIPSEGTIQTARGGDALSALKELGEKAKPILESAHGIAQNLQSATAPLAEADFQKDLRDTAHHLSTVLGYVAQGDGLANRLFTDKGLADSVEQSMVHIRASTQQLSETLHSVQSIIAELEKGDGAGHELIYGKEGKRLIHNLANATGELAILMKDVRTTDSTVHDLFYGNEAEDLLKNLTAVSQNFKVISDDLRDGKGTIGGLLVDPSLYEDMKRLVGNLQRNEILRALVRYSIRQDEAAGKLEIKKKED